MVKPVANKKKEEKKLNMEPRLKTYYRNVMLLQQFLPAIHQAWSEFIFQQDSVSAHNDS